MNIPHVGEELSEVVCGLLVPSQAASIMIKLEIVGKERHQPVDVVRVESVKDRRVHLRNGFNELA